MPSTRMRESPSAPARSPPCAAARGTAAAIWSPRRSGCCTLRASCWPARARRAAGRSPPPDVQNSRRAAAPPAAAPASAAHTAARRARADRARDGDHADAAAELPEPTAARWLNFSAGARLHARELPALDSFGLGTRRVPERRDPSPDALRQAKPRRRLRPEARIHAPERLVNADRLAAARAHRPLCARPPHPATVFPECPAGRPYDDLARRW
jgi:hypothetical protein